MYPVALFKLSDLYMVLHVVLILTFSDYELMNHETDIELCSGQLTFHNLPFYIPIPLMIPNLKGYMSSAFCYI
jgi:hypothetical protein